MRHKYADMIIDMHTFCKEVLIFTLVSILNPIGLAIMYLLTVDPTPWSSIVTLYMLFIIAYFIMKIGKHNGSDPSDDLMP